MITAHLLALHPFVKDFDSEQIVDLAACATPRRFHPGALIFREEEPAEACYLVRAGHVALQLHAPDGPLIVETITGEQVLGWSWLVPPHRWRFDAVAMDEVDTFELDAGCVRDQMRRDPAFGSAVAQLLLGVVSDRLEHTRIRLLDVYGHHHARGH
jgi:CRP/FNR family cyclic AMP-dependent transcriptional regulator